jgi:hypothetical protein
MRASHLRNTLLAVFSLFLFSCAAKRAPERITVIAPETFTGKIKITACEPQAPPDNIVIDLSGNGKTSVCSASPDLKLLVIRGEQSIEVPAKVAKTGDDFVVSITGEVR